MDISQLPVISVAPTCFKAFSNAALVSILKMVKSILGMDMLYVQDVIPRAGAANARQWTRYNADLSRTFYKTGKRHIRCCRTTEATVYRRHRQYFPFPSSPYIINCEPRDFSSIMGTFNAACRLQRRRKLPEKVRR